MDRELIAAGGTLEGHGLRLKVALAVFVLALGAVALFVTQRPASAQVGGLNISAIICPILNTLANAFGGFFRSIISGLLQAFGCAGISG